MRVTFGDFTLDTDTRQLRRGREHAEVHLSPMAFDLLAIRVASRPAVVSKESLRDRLWAGTNVVDANLNNLASEIRAALGDDPQQPRYLETGARRGYRFIAAPGGAPTHSAPAVERNAAAGPGNAALAALTALCRGDAALADLIRTLAATLERERLVVNES